MYATKVTVTTFDELYYAFTHPKSFSVALLCPDCKTPLVEYSCSACKDRAVRTNPAGLAQRYQNDPATYDQAGACYLRWMITASGASFYPVPAGFVAFLRNYRLYANTHADQRTALFDAVVAQVCGCSLASIGPDSWTGALSAAFTGSVDQERFLESFFSEAEASGKFSVMAPIVEGTLGKDEASRRQRAGAFFHNLVRYGYFVKGDGDQLLQRGQDWRPRDTDYKQGVKLPQGTILDVFTGTRAEKHGVDVMIVLDVLEEVTPTVGHGLSLSSTIDRDRKQRAATSGEWNLAVMSGLITGVVLAVAIRMMGPVSIPVIGLVYAFFIQNKNFSFSGSQKIVATLIALAIGTYGKQIVELFGELYR